MISDKKLRANRANALRSTGPRTPEGKAAVGRNAVKHGLSSKEVIVRDDEHDEYAAFSADLLATIDPVGALEQDLFRHLLHAAWNLRRLRRLEAELYSPDIDPIIDNEMDSSLARLARYHHRYERTYHRALRELRVLQTNRMLAREHAAFTGRQPIPLSDMTAVTKQTQQLMRQSVPEPMSEEEYLADKPITRSILEQTTDLSTRFGD